MKHPNNDYTLIQIYNEAINLFLFNIDLSIDIEEDHIHKLRVNIKNLRAIIILVKTIKEKEFKKKKVSALISQIFKPTGELRNIQIEQLLLEHYDSKAIQIYKDHLTKIEEETGINAKKALLEFNKNDFNSKNEKARQIIEKINDKELCSGLQKLIRKEFEKIIQIRTKLQDDKALHEIRKHLKVLKSILKIQLVINQDNTTEDLLNQINATETLIGNWHDKELLIESISQFIENNINDPKSNLLANIVGEIKIENKNAPEKINFNLNEIFSSNNL
jgi:CHAD domain-containing protein